uniref:Uncharacterized protein n=1 Tax=Arundo donax TaxID=35708 RepID=A0A0A9BUT1_ARUDO
MVHIQTLQFISRSITVSSMYLFLQITFARRK